MEVIVPADNGESSNTRTFHASFCFFSFDHIYSPHLIERFRGGLQGCVSHPYVMEASYPLSALDRQIANCNGKVLNATQVAATPA